HVVVGTFKAPYLLGDPASRDPDARFHVDFRNGNGDVRSDEVQWAIVVPKAAGGRKQPFPVALWGHEVAGHADDALLFGGDFARQGVALVGYNAPGHGLVVTDAQRTLAQAILTGNCFAPLAGTITRGRARDLDGDGTAESGSAWWTAHVLHAR